MGRLITDTIEEAIMAMPDGSKARVRYSPTAGLQLLDAPDGAKPSSGGGGEQPQPSDGESPDTSDTIQSIRLQIAKLLKQNKVGKVYVPRQTKGRLDTTAKSLVRAMTGGKNIYKRQVKPTRGYNFLFLVDTSGSMNGDKIVLANNVLHSLMQGLDMDGVSTAVLDFSRNLIWQKGWHQSSSDLKRLHANGGNGDYQALQYALRYGFTDAPEERKNVLIMLSDGEPCDDILDTVVMPDGKERRNPLAGGTHTEDTDRIRLMVQAEAAKRYIALYGIGILEGGQQIPRHSVVKELSDLQVTIEKVIKGLL